tara:strand:+ start:151 stop:270 length:120 start_codon:yes stop_codon:yes gene_type:complete
MKHLLLAPFLLGFISRISGAEEINKQKQIEAIQRMYSEN